MRPVQERWEYALAAAIEPGVVATYRKRMGRQVESGFNDRARGLDRHHEEHHEYERQRSGREQTGTWPPSRRVPRLARDHAIADAGLGEDVGGVVGVVGLLAGEPLESQPPLGPPPPSIAAPLVSPFRPTAREGCF